MPVTEERKTTRVQIEMGEGDFARLLRVEEKSEASSHVEAIKRAIRLYEYILDEQNAGRDLAFVNMDCTIVNKVIFV